MKRPALAVFLILSAAGCARDRGVQAAEGQKARAVRTEAAQVRDVRRQVDLVGTLAAREEVVVSAEVAGRVSRLVHDLGDRVAAGAPLIELDPEKLQYRADGQRATLDQARARYGASGDGELPPLDKVPTVLKSRPFAIEGEVPNPDGRLKPGTFARVQITTDRVERAVTVPVAAVQSRYGTNRVFVVKDGQLAGREIVLGDRLGDRVEVSQGLDAGTIIVAGDVEQLADGMKPSPAARRARSRSSSTSRS